MVDGRSTTTIDEGILEPLVEEEHVDARIVRTKQFTAKPMDPGEAALQLQLLGHDFYLFTNSETGRAAVLYRRHDGDLGLIETLATGPTDRARSPSVGGGCTRSGRPRCRRGRRQCGTGAAAGARAT